MDDDVTSSPTEPQPRSMAPDFLESSPYAQIAYTFDLEILAVNARHCAMTGVPPERS